jgi:HEAT repeat protein
MRSEIWPAAIAIGLFLLLAAARPASAIEWEEFDDPQALLLTEPFARSIRALPEADQAAAIRRLTDSLKSDVVEIRRRAALTLDKLGDKSGVPTMIEALTTATGRDRDSVVVALRILKDKRAIPALRKVLQDKSPYVRGIAVAALGELKAKEAYDEIVALTKDKGTRPDEKVAGRLNCLPNSPAILACYALGALGERRAVPVLIELVPDKDLHYSAVQALEALTEQKLGNDPEKWKVWWKQQDR